MASPQLIQRITSCEQQNTMIREWIRDKLGPNLEELTVLIKQIVKESMEEELKQFKANQTNTGLGGTRPLSGSASLFGQQEPAPSSSSSSSINIFSSPTESTSQTANIFGQPMPSSSNPITNSNPISNNKGNLPATTQPLLKPQLKTGTLGPQLKGAILKPILPKPTGKPTLTDQPKQSASKKSSLKVGSLIFEEEDLPDLDFTGTGSALGGLSGNTKKKTLPLAQDKIFDEPQEAQQSTKPLIVVPPEASSFEEFMSSSSLSTHVPADERKETQGSSTSSKKSSSASPAKEKEGKKTSASSSTTTAKKSSSSMSKKATPRETAPKKGAKLLEELIEDNEEWTDSEEEEIKKKQLEKRKAPASQKLQKIEASLIPLPVNLLKEDTGIFTTMARLNIEHSVKIHETSYGIGTRELMDKLRPFSDKGGKVLFVPPDLKTTPWVFGVLPTDQFFPICDSGLGRSQILYQFLLGVKRAHGLESGVNLPSGYSLGYDIESDKNTAFLPKNANPYLDKCFMEAFGVSKVDRFGEKEGQKFHNVQKESVDWKKQDKNRQHMKDWFDLNYYHISPKRRNGRRQIFVVFERGLIPVVQRLLESNTSLELIHVIAVPYPDDLVVPKDSNEMRQLKLNRDQYCAWKHLQHYKRFASIFHPWSG